MGLLKPPPMVCKDCDRPIIIENCAHQADFYRHPDRYCPGCWQSSELHRGTTITELEEIVDVVCGTCGDATNNAEPFCNGPICFKRGD